MNQAKPELSRDMTRSKLGGVCSGLARHFGIELWLVRIFVFTGFLFSGSFMLIAYVAAWLILDPYPKDDSDSKKNGYTSHEYSPQPMASHASEVNAHGDRVEIKPVEVKAKIWQAGEPPKQALSDIVAQFQIIQSRVEKMEKYVTSPQFTVAREINKL